MKRIKKYLPLILILSILPILLAADISGATLKAAFTVDNLGARDIEGLPTSWTMPTAPLQDAGLLNSAADNVAICAAADCTGADDIPILAQSPGVVDTGINCSTYDGYTGGSGSPNCSSTSSGSQTFWTRNYSGSYLQIYADHPFTQFNFDLILAISTPFDGEWQYQSSNGGWTPLDGVTDTSNMLTETCQCKVSWTMPDKWYRDYSYRIRLVAVSGSDSATYTAFADGGSFEMGVATWYATPPAVAAGSTEAYTMYMGGPSMGGGGPTKYPIYMGRAGMIWSANPYYYPPYYGFRVEIHGYFSTKDGAQTNGSNMIANFDTSNNGFKIWVGGTGKLMASMGYNYMSPGQAGVFDDIPITDGYHELIIETPAWCSYTCGYAYVDGVQVETMNSTWTYFTSYGGNPYMGGSGDPQGTNGSGMVYVDYLDFQNFGYNSQNRQWSFLTQWDGATQIMNESPYSSGSPGYPTVRGMSCTHQHGYDCGIQGSATSVYDYYFRPGSLQSSSPLHATIGAFESTAAAPPPADTSLPPMDVVSANYLTTGQFAADTSLGTLPGSGFIQSVATSANVPAKFLWVLISCGVVMLVIGAAMKFLKNSVLACLIGGIVLTGFSVPAVGVYPIWVVFFYAVIAIVVVIIGRRFGVSV